MTDLIVHGLDELLLGRNPLGDLFAHRTTLDAVDQGRCHIEIDVCVEEGATDRFEGRLDGVFSHSGVDKKAIN